MGRDLEENNGGKGHVFFLDGKRKWIYLRANERTAAFLSFVFVLDYIPFFGWGQFLIDTFRRHSLEFILGSNFEEICWLKKLAPLQKWCQCP
jgi:hypothetical protein